MKLKTRFTLVYGIGGTVFLFLVTLLVFLSMESAMEKQLKKQFLTDAESRIEGLNNRFISLKDQFKSVANVPMFRNMRFHQLTLNQAAYDTDIRQLELYFLDLIKQHPEVDRIQYVDKNAKELIHVNAQTIKRNLSDLSQDSVTNNMLSLDKNLIQVTQLTISDLNNHLIWWVPVTVSSNEKSGILKFSISYQFLVDAVSALATSESETVCLYDGVGLLVFSTNNAPCRNNQTDNWYLTDDLSIPGFPLKLTISSTPKVFLKEVNEIALLVFTIIFPIIALIAFMLAYTYSRNIVFTIEKLVKTAREMGRKSSHTDIFIDRKDELGVLGDEMNRSAHLIEDNRLALEQKNRDLESYSYTLAHDLRTPLRSIASFSQILKMDAESKLNEEEKDILDRIVNSSKRMSTLINDILELSKLSNSQPKVEKVCLSHMVKKIMSELKTTEPERKIEAIIKENIYANGDPQLLMLVLENLLQNAFKYSRLNTVSHIKFGETSKDGSPIYYVRDDGVGFDMTFSNKLFKPFQRLHREDEFEGTGIGLASVNRLIELHEGRVWIESELNKGTTVYFTLWEALKENKNPDSYNT